MTMNGSKEGFAVGIEFKSVLAAISKQIYETPLAFIRENAQNAVDALRLQAVRDGKPSSTSELSVEITVESNRCEIVDNGIGMTQNDLKSLFWTIGASGKRTPEAKEAGCVGMFGIGGFANFGVCDELTVVSQVEHAGSGYLTRLTSKDIEEAVGPIPLVHIEENNEAGPRGTIVRGLLIKPANIQELDAYVRDFLRYAEEHIYFNGELVSRQPFQPPNKTRDGLQSVEDSFKGTWTDGKTIITGNLNVSPGGVLHADITGLIIGEEPVRAHGWIRFENGQIDALKRGFKLCSTTIGTQIGVSGVIDCDYLAPTAGRASLNAESNQLLASIANAMEKAAVMAVLKSPDLIGHHTRIFKYVRRNGLVPHLANVRVDIADESEMLLADIKRRSEGDIKVFYATTKNPSLSKALQAGGHMVVQLPADGNKQAAVKEYLETFCSAKKFEGQIECLENYEDLSRFEKAMLAEIEEVVLSNYDIPDAQILPGRLTENLPVYAKDIPGTTLTIYVDVRHSEITKLQGLGITPLFSSMVSEFCREHLSQILRTRSPKFFGSGAVNLDWLSKSRSELWLLVPQDIEVHRRAAQRQIVRKSDVQVVKAGQSSEEQAVETNANRTPKLVKIEGTDEFADLSGYYLRIPKRASEAYGDVIQQCDSRCAVWAGNNIRFVASDQISSAFQVEIQLDRLINTGSAESTSSGGFSQEQRPLQSLYEGLYFPIPTILEDYIVPSEDDEVRIEIDCDWIDFSSAKVWRAREEEELGTESA